jgi:hypothetical protein
MEHPSPDLPDNHTGGIVKGNLLLAAATLFLAGCASEATAPVIKEANPAPRASTNTSVLLFDTGPGGPGGIGTIDLFASGATNCLPQPACAVHFQLLGGQFTLASDATIDGVQGWMETSAGSMDVHIRNDASGRPGTDVYTQNYSMSAQTAGWAVFSNFNVSLPAGTYWVTFEPVPSGGIQGSMPGGVANPSQGTHSLRTATSTGARSRPRRLASEFPARSTRPRRRRRTSAT